MKAAFINETGGPEKINYGDLPDPQCGPEDVLVRVKKVSVNPIDTYIRNGANYWPLPYPYIIGSDFAGEVIEVGSKVDVRRYGFLIPGARVWGSNQGLLGRQGSFAEKICVKPEWVYPTPDSVADEAVAAIALVGLTAQIGLFERARIKQDESIFVRGGTGGVGSMVVQIAAAAGARVITTAGDDAKAERCKSFGAQAVIKYKEQDVLQEILKFAPKGVNVYWETLRTPDFDQVVAALSECGRMVLMAGRDARPQFPVGPFYVKGCSIYGFAMFKSSPDIQRQCAEQINELLASGRLKPSIDRVIPLSEAAEAHRVQQESTVGQSCQLSGKIVLSV